MRTRGRLAGVAVLALLSTMGCSGGGKPDPASWAASAPTSPPATPMPVEPLAHGFGAAPTPAIEPAPVEPEPTRERPAGAAPDPEPPTEAPPPPPPRYEGECVAQFDGEAVSQSMVASALADAASRTYWPTSAPDIQVPENLLRATAWQESGWQSNIIACDGGVGLMQVMPDTAEWMNTRFGQSYDIHHYTDNAYLGATYLAWLTKYIGDWHFDADYSLDPGACADHLDHCLLNAVIAGYNFGHQAVAPHDGEITIPNPRYVDNVRSLMVTCDCLSY